ncbi:holo-ACP synthase [Paenibacillus guangzhouensis]|uniref:holo-ACP synthase n=1 Tax=Paenibacillus guangzhouensis TaxID=1473112 RepID=UPI00126714E2|nr:holo-ACP synthase [Paenibacillus guangzhouensis]
MIVGMGHDILEIERIADMRERSSWDRFLHKVLTDAERNLASDRGGRIVEFVAGRFAAKEAVVKALGCGIGEKVGFTDIEILPDDHGKPGCTLSMEAWKRLVMDKQEYTIHVSITHQRSLASAMAIVEYREDTQAYA